MKKKNQKNLIIYTSTKQGSKTEPYCTEKEMLFPTVYSYNTLSKAEKIIYKKYNMNHGIINKTYYLGKLINKKNLYSLYPELLELEKYFNKTKKRDRYLVAMKYEAIKIAKNIYPEIILKELAKIINVANHASVHYYINRYIPLENHAVFIKDNFDHCIANNLYPLTPELKSLQKTIYYKHVNIDNNNHEYVPKTTFNKKRKYTYKIKREKL